MAIKGIKIGSTTNKIDIAALESEGNAGKFIKAGSSGPVWDSPVTGTNDGTNWTSLSIQTASGLQEYAIPSGGGGTTLNQYSFTMTTNSSAQITNLYNIFNNCKGNISVSIGSAQYDYKNNASSTIQLTNITRYGTSSYNYLLIRTRQLSSTSSNNWAKSVKIDFGTETPTITSTNDTVAYPTVTYWNDTEITQ